MAKSLMSSNQPSITEWLASIGESVDAEKLRDEDNKRLDRWKILNNLIGFPADLPVVFEAKDLVAPSEKFKELLKERGEELSAIRLVPKTPDLPKLRQRGLTLNDCHNNWFKKQDIDLDKYLAEVYYHIEPKAWATTFIINKDAIFGEIIQGSPSQLTHGETEHTLYQFNFDYTDWTWSEDNKEAQVALNKMIDCVKVESAEKQKLIKEKLSADFHHNYLEGYYEAFIGVNGKMLFIDYGQLLVKYIKNPPIIKIKANKEKNLISGAVAYRGSVRGKIKIVDIINFKEENFQQGDILVCDNTDVRYVPLMKKSAAILTNRGGILSHAAIVARELGKPCIIGIGNATTVLKDGDMVEVDAENGIISKL